MFADVLVLSLWGLVLGLPLLWGCVQYAAKVLCIVRLRWAVSNVLDHLEDLWWEWFDCTTQEEIKENPFLAHRYELEHVQLTDELARLTKELKELGYVFKT